MGHVTRMEDMRNAYKILDGRPRRGREDEVGGWTGCVWRGRWRAPVSTVISLGAPWGAGSFLTCWVTRSSERGTLLHGLTQECPDF
jgi:hypothetical protein